MKRDDISPMDVANAVEKYFETFPKTTEEEMAKELSMTQGNISNMRRVVKLPKEVLDKVNEGIINFTMARELCVLIGLKAGEHEHWNRKEGKNEKEVTDDKALMLETIKHITANTYDKCQATVNGIRKAIFLTAQAHFPRLDRVQYARWETLFDTKKDCAKCGKVLKADETQSQKAHFCTDIKCWEKHKAAHDKVAAQVAARKMEADIAARVVKDVNAPKDISQEIKSDSAAEKLLTKSEIAILEKAQAKNLEQEASEEKLHEDRRRKQLEGQGPDYPCLKCATIGTCDGTGVRSESTNQGNNTWKTFYTCERMVSAKITPAQITEKATVKIPADLMEKIKGNAGTRGEVLDIHKLSTGSYYNSALAKGHILLDNCLEEMSDPQECVLRCTQGFHYGYDSSKPGKTYRVCSNPKCVSKKKAAATRERNARGMLRKKAEAAAIDEAISKTDKIGKPEMELILYAQMAGKFSRNYYGSQNDSAVQWIAEALGLKVPGGYDERKGFGDTIMKKLDEMDEAKMARMVVRLMLEAFKGDSKDMQHYKIESTSALNLLHVGINIPKEAKEPEKTQVEQSGSTVDNEDDEDIPGLEEAHDSELEEVPA